MASVPCREFKRFNTDGRSVKTTVVDYVEK